MNYEFALYELQQIALLPLDIQALKDKYPVDIANVAEYYFEPPLELGYKPTVVEFFYDDASEPEMMILDGKLDCLEPRKPNPNYPLTAMMVDGHWVYMEIEGRVLLDRRGGMIMPENEINESQAALFKSAAKSISALGNW